MSEKVVSIHHPHDSFFKVAMKNKRVAIDFLQAHLPAKLFSQIDIETLKVTDKSYVSPKLKHIHSDIVYSSKIAGQAGYIIIIIEHESTSREKFMPFRKLQYSVGAMDDHLSQGHDKLPIILNLCLYHGKKSPYPHSTDLFELFENPEMAREYMFKNFKLIDLTVMSEEEIQQHGLATLMETLFKHCRDKDLLRVIRQLIEQEILQQTIRFMGKNFLMAMLHYIHGLEARNPTIK